MKRILFLSKGEDSSSTRYRALQFFPLLRDDGFEVAHATAAGGLLPLLSACRQAAAADVVVVLRKTFPAPIQWLLRRCARRLVFDFDDAIFCNTDGSPSATRMRRFAAMVGDCDHVMAGNAFLQRQAEAFNREVTRVPTALAAERYAAAAEKATGSIDLVWIGSSSTRKYLVDALSCLSAAAARVPGLRLKVIADFDLPEACLPVLPVRWQADSEARELASANIGIAPMRDDDWSRGKCALKVLQYMAAGLPVVSSRCGVNAEIVEDGVDGFLVDGEEGWAARIAELAADTRLRETMGAAGRQKVMAGFDLRPVYQRLRSVLDDVLRD
ncbi:MAG: glycosyltransferase family 4 protein [Betaproteobacteria bacterium]|nr:glycosyltransferase family 4 protein [Betaproteobacteria bacterium]